MRAEFDSGLLKGVFLDVFAWSMSSSRFPLIYVQNTLFTCIRFYFQPSSPILSLTRFSHHQTEYLAFSRVPMMMTVIIPRQCC